MKKITISADDYAYDHSVSKGIIELLQLKRIQATSCMVNRPAWRSDAQPLRAYVDKADLGLHLNLTEGEPCSEQRGLAPANLFPGLPTLLIKILSGDIQVADIVREIHAQLDAFEAQIGHLPDFVDGHQHVHQLPIVREALFEVYQERLRASYIRLAFNGWASAIVPGFPRALLVALLGGAKMKILLEKKGIPHNTSFAGFYRFSAPEKYPQYFAHFLSQLRSGGLLMCHPGAGGGEAGDPIYKNRSSEFAFFKSAAFTQACQEADCKGVRFRDH